jgi:phosphoglycolate phosphatase-like HAD superfamily hydrolase
MTLLIFDVDNTILNKHTLEDAALRDVSNTTFHRDIGLLTHPVTGDRDTNFAQRSHKSIWTYKLQQVLDSGEKLCDYTHLSPEGTPRRIHAVQDVDIPALVTGIATATRKRIDGQDVGKLVHMFFPPEFIHYVSSATSDIGIATLGFHDLQQPILSGLGYFVTPTTGKPVSEDLCIYGDAFREKDELLMECLSRYRKKHSQDPRAIMYVGDALRDMIGLRKLDATGIPCRALGIATGQNTMEELRAAGADMVAPSIADRPSAYWLRAYVRYIPPRR